MSPPDPNDARPDRRAESPEAPGDEPIPGVSSSSESTGGAIAEPRRETLAERTTRELGRLRSDREAWADYLSEAEQSSVTDGLE